MINSRANLPRRGRLPPLGVVDRFNFDPTVRGVQCDASVFRDELKHATISNRVSLSAVVTNWAHDRVGILIFLVVPDPYLECHKGIVA
ncbi:Uncharacterised protein [Mycobacteroides abscessus subsp. massiliense]|nr:Uncharacterised protein [Mycobacteroides abscessus subsp. massiliense]SLH29635.1 Uncharacterised protein [Mycobacteroides abscessus subsp. massiliense]